MPKAERTIIALGDVGDGIPKTIRAKHAVGSDLDALRHALVPGVSGDNGGGNGLGVARTVTETLPGGAMTIESVRRCCEFVPQVTAWTARSNRRRVTPG
jgi:hypothetical protein